MAPDLRYLWPGVFVLRLLLTLTLIVTVLSAVARRKKQKSKGATGNDEIRQPQPQITQVEPFNQQQNTPKNLDNAVDRIDQYDPTKPDDHQKKPEQKIKYTEKIVRFFKAIGLWLRPWICPPIIWMTRNHGFMTFLATAAIAVLTFVYVKYSRKQWETMDRQLTFSQQQFDMAQRPSIEPRLDGMSPLVFQDGRWRADVIASMKNHGQSVALNIGYFIDMVPLPNKVNAQFGPALQRQQWWCDANRHPKKTFVTGHILFPTQEQPMPTTVGVSEKDLAGDIMGLAIVGCVHYRASYDPPERPTRQTRFAYMVSISNKDMITGIPKSKTEPTPVFLYNLAALWSYD